MNLFVRSHFSLALLAALFFATGFAAAQDDAGTASSSSESMFYVKVMQDKEITGTVIGLSDVKVTTGFGEVAIPLEKLDGIKLHADGDDSAVFAFKNGDVITGKLNLSELVVKTEWGKANINTEHIQTITTTKDARFYADTGSGGKGWRFTRATSGSGARTSTSQFGQ